MVAKLNSQDTNLALSATQASVVDEVFWSMVEFCAPFPKRIEHFVKVRQYACYLASLENVTGIMRLALELACIVHDIGNVKHAPYEQNKSCPQSKEALNTAMELMQALHDFSPDNSPLKYELTPELIHLVCVLVENYGAHAGDVSSEKALQILREADSLVHFQEDNVEPSDIVAYVAYFFKSKSALELAHIMYAPYFSATFPLPIVSPQDIPYIQKLTQDRVHAQQKKRLSFMPPNPVVGRDRLAHAVDNVILSKQKPLLKKSILANTNLEDIANVGMDKIQQRAEILRNLSPYQQMMLKRKLKDLKQQKQYQMYKERALKHKLNQHVDMTKAVKQVDLTESIMNIDLNRPGEED